MHRRSSATFNTAGFKETKRSGMATGLLGNLTECVPWLSLRPSPVVQSTGTMKQIYHVDNMKTIHFQRQYVSLNEHLFSAAGKRVSLQ